MIRVLALHINDDESHIMCIIRRKAKCLLAAINFGVVRVPGSELSVGGGGKVGGGSRLGRGKHTIIITPDNGVIITPPDQGASDLCRLFSAGRPTLYGSFSTSSLSFYLFIKKKKKS